MRKDRSFRGGNGLAISSWLYLGREGGAGKHEAAEEEKEMCSRHTLCTDLDARTAKRDTAFARSNRCFTRGYF